jgi:hypothetical protein
MSLSQDIDVVLPLFYSVASTYSFATPASQHSRNQSPAKETNMQTMEFPAKF